MQPQTDRHPNRRRGTAPAGLAVLLAACLAMTLPPVEAQIDPPVDPPVSPAVAISVDSIEIDEGSRATFMVHLVGDDAPTKRVTLKFTPQPGIRVTPATLQFAPGKAGVDRTVTVAALDDKVAVGKELALAYRTTSQHLAYHGLNGTLGVTVTDNDVAGIQVLETKGTVVKEGGARDSIRVRLTSQPNGTVQLDVGAPTVCSLTDSFRVSTGALTFTPKTWNRFQTVALVACDDQDFEGPEPDQDDLTISVNEESADEYVDADPKEIVVTVLDNEAGLLLTAVEDSELGFVGFDVSLASRPSSPVVVQAVEAVCDEEEGCEVDPLPGGLAIQPAALRFSAKNWNVPQFLAVASVDLPADLVFLATTKDASFAPLAGTLESGAAFDPRAWLPFLEDGEFGNYQRIEWSSPE